MRPLLLAVLLAGFWPTEAARPRRQEDAVVVEAGPPDRYGGPQQPDAEPPPTAADCQLPPSSGPCRGLFTYYYYDSRHGTCRPFRYSGCGGNGNRFQSAQRCEDACGGARAGPRPQRAPQTAGEDGEDGEDGDQAAECSWGRPPRCTAGCAVLNDPASDCPRCECSAEARRKLCAQPPARGHCRALLTRWRFDPETGRCDQFKFGGCDGNANNFASERQCLDTCAGLRPQRPRRRKDSAHRQQKQQQTADGLGLTEALRLLAGLLTLRL